MGIEPTLSAWKAEVLPLNYTREHQIYCTILPIILWRGQDSNLRRQSRQIYSLIPLTTREPLRQQTENFELKLSQCQSKKYMGGELILPNTASPAT